MMKIALTVKGAGLGAWLDEDFSHCGHLMIVGEDNRFESWENPEKSEEIDGNSKLIDFLINNNVDVLITGKISAAIKSHLLNAGIKIFDNKSGTVFDLLDEARQP